MAEQRNTLTYRDAGVDIDAGNSLVERIKPAAAATDAAGRDGRARRLRRALRPESRRASAIRSWSPRPMASARSSRSRSRCGEHRTIGIDLVAMCVNDLVVQGAEPLLFLDYFASGALDVDAATRRDRGHRRGLPHGRRRACRRRDGGDAGPLRQGRLRPRRLCRRRGRARSDPAARRSSRRATSSSASPRPAFIRTASRWSGAIVERSRAAAGPIRAPFEPSDEPRRGAARRRRASMCAPASRRSARPAR